MTNPNVDSSKVVQFFHSTQNYSRTSIADLLAIASKDEIKKVIYDDRFYSIGLDDFTDFLPTYKDMKLENGMYFVGDKPICTIEENAAIGKKYMAMMGQAANLVETNNVPKEQGKYSFHEDHAQIFSLQALDPHDPVAQDVELLQKKLDLLANNRQYIPVATANKLFKRMKGIVMKLNPYTITEVPNDSVEINNYHYACTDLVMEIIKMVKSKTAFDVVYALRGIIQKGNNIRLSYVQGKLLVTSISAPVTSGVLTPPPVQVQQVARIVTPEEVNILKLLEESKKDEIAYDEVQIAFLNFANKHDIKYNFGVEEIMPLYNAWLKNQAFAPLPPPNLVSNQPILPIINNPFCSTIPIVNLPSGSPNLVNQPNGYISNQVDGHKIEIKTNGYNAPILTNVPDSKKIPYENFYSQVNLKASPEIANLLPNVPFTYLQADDEMRFKTMQSFQSCIGLDGGKYTIRTPFGTKKFLIKKNC